MILYHGSNVIVKYPEIRKARYNKICRASRALGSQIWKEGVFE